MQGRVALKRASLIEGDYAVVEDFPRSHMRWRKHADDDVLCHAEFHSNRG